MTRSRRNATLVSVAILTAWALAACATLLVSPQSVSEKIAAGYIAQTSVLRAATVALNTGDISSADAEQVLKIATEARKVLDGAKLASEAGDVKTAEGRLAMATTILTELQAFLREKS